MEGFWWRAETQSAAKKIKSYTWWIYPPPNKCRDPFASLALWTSLAIHASPFDRITKTLSLLLTYYPGPREFQSTFTRASTPFCPSEHEWIIIWSMKPLIRWPNSVADRYFTICCVSHKVARASYFFNNFKVCTTPSSHSELVSFLFFWPNYILSFHSFLLSDSWKCIKNFDSSCHSFSLPADFFIYWGFFLGERRLLLRLLWIEDVGRRAVV